MCVWIEEDRATNTYAAALETMFNSSATEVKLTCDDEYE